MKVITFLNFRGGCGKSSNLQNIASILSKKHGKRILVIDCDPQGNTSFTFQANKEDPTILDVLRQEVKAEDALQKMEYGSLITSCERLFSAEKLITGKEREYRLLDALEPVKDRFDYCLIDTGPNLSILSTNALIASDSVIIPLLPDGYSMQALAGLAEILRKAQDGWNPGLRIEGFIINKVEPDKLSRDALNWAEKTAESLNTKLFKTPIRNSVRVAEAQISKSTLIDSFPKNKVTQDYLEVVEELIEGERI